MTVLTVLAFSNAKNPTVAAGAAVVSVPNTGTGGSSGGNSDFTWLIAALALAGFGLAGAGTFVVRRRS